jgi:hypothetical protein
MGMLLRFGMLGETHSTSVRSRTFRGGQYPFDDLNVMKRCRIVGIAD